VSEQILNDTRHVSTFRLFSAILVIHDGSGKHRTEDKLRTETRKKANNTKHSKTKLAWFSHFLEQLA